MKTYRKEIKCLILVAFCFYHVLSQEKSCDELRHHRNWPEMRLASSVCGLTGASVAPRVMGGRPAALVEFPWMALLTFSCCARDRSEQPEGVATCGGFLITGRHVLTAGHCCDVNRIVKGCDVTGVILGEYDRATSIDCYRGRCAPEPIRVPVKKVTIHEDYNKKKTFNDICLLTLERSVHPSTYVSPICLPEECTWKEPDYKRDEHSEQLKVAGWGRYATVSPSVLQTLNMLAIPHSKCSSLYEAVDRKIDESRQLCTEIELGRNVCQGDSGGPLMYQTLFRMVAVGIVSFGQNCSADKPFQFPSVHTRVSHYIPWILDNMSH